MLYEVEPWMVQLNTQMLSLVSIINIISYQLLSKFSGSSFCYLESRIIVPTSNTHEDQNNTFIETDLVSDPLDRKISKLTRYKSSNPSYKLILIRARTFFINKISLYSKHHTNYHFVHECYAFFFPLKKYILLPLLRPDFFSLVLCVNAFPNVYSSICNDYVSWVFKIT